MKITERVRRRADRLTSPAGSTPPAGSAVAVYAGLLDGETLWLAVDAPAGVIALRDTRTGDLVELDNDLDEADPRYLAVRADLGGLGGDAPVSYAVVLVPPDGAARPLWVAPFPDVPTVTPPSCDGRAQLGLGRGRDGTLEVTREPLPAAARLRSVSAVPEGIELLLDDVGAGGDLLLVADDGAVRASWPLVADGDLFRGVLTVDGLPTTGERFGKLAVGTPASSKRIRRRANGLADPHAAVVLPELVGEDPENPVARLRWSPEATLALRLLHLEDDGTSS